MVSSVFRISRSRVPYGTSVLYSDMLAAYSYILHQTTGRLSTPMSNGRWRNHRQLSRTLARTLWPGQNPWGQMITTDGGTAGRRLSRRPSARPFQDFLPTDSSDEPGLKRSIRTGSHGNLSG